ncbi:MAG: hypothetical protein ACRDWA_16410 [Acidimicrobiia bacterium]
MRKQPTADQGPSGRSATPTAVRRSGPVSRIYRLTLAALLVLGAYSLFLDGSPGFDPSTGAEPGFWILAAAAIPVAFREFPQRLIGHRWSSRLLVGVGVLLILGAAVAVAVEGRVWASPFTTLVFGAVLAASLLVATTLVLSTLTGTPGCDVGALEELVRRIDGTFNPDDLPNHPCGAGFHRLDAWESRQAWRRHHR